MLVVVGTGPDERALRASAGKNVRVLGRLGEEQLRWLYANCRALVSASYEDFGLTPLEAAAFGKPSAVLRWGGFLDTVVEGETGTFFAAPTPSDIGRAVAAVSGVDWDGARLRQQAASFSEEAFIRNIRVVVEAEAAVAAG
jgi:glycosyltransferase involved in cell wall biosynthesis